jgi:ribulose 1,5-bisphosphate synthetase/thiazole synthase
MERYMTGKTSGTAIPVWIKTSATDLSYPSLIADQSTDVCVIGAGIAGLSTAYLLAREGQSVIVLEDGQPGSGESGRTTAHLSNVLDDRYYELEHVR